ncbi:ABC transporter substrate-binding protein [Candidatus Pacearchaeota archaeon]|nr:ABC transporter substrate-binding protein [Candidatus Pacearchaeota archaeon]
MISLKKKDKWLVVGLVLLIVMGFVIYSNNNSKKGDIVIGAVLGLSGAGQFTGPQTLGGMEIAVEEINSHGGINGKQIKLAVEDSKGVPNDGISGFNKIYDLSNPNIIVSGMTAVSNSLAPIAYEKKIPLLAIINADPNIARNEYSFRFYPYAKQENEPVIKMIKERNLSKVGIIYQNDDFGKAIYNDLKENFEGEIISESFATSNSEFRTQLLKIKNKNPKLIVVAGFATQTSNILKQIKEMNINSTIIGCSILALPDTRRSAGDSAEGVYVSAPIFYEETNIKAREFEEKFKTKYPNLVVDHYAANGYDTIYLIKQIIEKNGESREKIKKGLIEIKDSDFEGILRSIQVDGRNIIFPLKKAIIEKGEIKYLQ